MLRFVHAEYGAEPPAPPDTNMHHRGEYGIRERYALVREQKARQRMRELAVVEGIRLRGTASNLFGLCMVMRQLFGSRGEPKLPSVLQGAVVQHISPSCLVSGRGPIAT